MKSPGGTPSPVPCLPPYARYNKMFQKQPQPAAGESWSRTKFYGRWAGLGCAVWEGCKQKRKIKESGGVAGEANRCVTCPECDIEAGTGSPSNLLMIFLHSLTCGEREAAVCYLPFCGAGSCPSHAHQPRPPAHQPHPHTHSNCKCAAGFSICWVFYLSTNYILNYVCFSLQFGS